MERTAKLIEARHIMGKNFIGPDELSLISDQMGIIIPNSYPDITFTLRELEEKKNDYLLILGVSQILGGGKLTLKSLRDYFGINSNINEPCFYNQDWYLNEVFINKSLKTQWYLVKKTLYENSRGMNPSDLKSKYFLPSAILCAFSFFCYWFHTGGDILWPYDFIWCEDFDHNGDQIYVGKYNDVLGVNKSGFSIHRHLTLREFYGCIDAYK
ncbi:MAG: hypothetical protein WC055_05885 [Melioribacteraceae bacterium]